MILAQVLGTVVSTRKDGGLSGLKLLLARSVVAFQGVSLEPRGHIIASIRAALTGQLDALARIAVDETGLGRYEDKILKNRLVIDKTPGLEDIEASVWTGDHGLTLVERAP